MIMDAAESESTDVKMLRSDGQESQSEKRSRLTKQLAFVIIASMTLFSLGTTLTWPSPALSDLALNNITLVGTELVLTPVQMDLTGSLVSLGCLLGSWAGGYMVARLGRRRLMQLIVAPLLTGNVALALAPNPAILLAARLVLGIAGGLSSVTCTLYVVEIADTTVRGAMSTLSSMLIVLGGLFSIGLGCVLHWYYLALVGTLPPSVLLIGTFFLPDSPAFLMVSGKEHDAVRTLRKLRGPYADLHPEIEMIKMKNSYQGGGWQKLLKWHTVKRIATVVMTFIFMHFCGNYIFVVHTARILRKVGIPWDADTSAVIVTVARIVGMLVSISLLDRLGRRFTLFASHAITAATLTVLGLFVFYAEAAPPEDTTFSTLAWVPLLCIIVAMFGMNVGAHPVPYLLAAEYFPTSVRGQTFSICYSSGMLTSFVVLQLYTPMMDALTQPGLYWFYAAVSCFAMVFTYIFVEETKGRNVG